MLRSELIAFGRGPADLARRVARHRTRVESVGRRRSLQGIDGARKRRGVEELIARVAADRTNLRINTDGLPARAFAKGITASWRTGTPSHPLPEAFSFLTKYPGARLIVGPLLTG